MLMNVFCVLVKDAGKAVKNVYENNVKYRHVLKYVFSFCEYGVVDADFPLGLISNRVSERA